jgi:hypothetical protein
VTGIQEPGNIEQYVHEVWGEANSCMDPSVRAAAVIGHINEQLATQGVPAIGWRFEASHGTGAVFDFLTWYVELGDSPYSMDVADNATPDQQAWQVQAVYHEARHAEQWYRMARERAGLGATAEQIVTVTHIPLHIAQWAVSDPIMQCDASQYEAEEWYESVYGAGRPHRHETLSDVHAHYQDYRNLPEEHDAWATGDAVTHEYHQQGGTHPAPAHPQGGHH